MPKRKCLSHTLLAKLRAWAPLLGLLIVSWGTIATVHGLQTDRFKIEMPDKSLEIWGILPADYPDQKSYSLILFMGEAQKDKPDYLAEMLAPEAKLPLLATEMSALFAFVMINKEELDKNYALTIKYAMKQFIGKYAVDESRLVIVGYKGGVLPAMKFLASEPRYASTLILVEPPADAATLKPAKAPPPNPRPALILAAANDNTQLAEKTRTALASFAGVTNVLVDKPAASKDFPANHVFAFLKYALPAVKFSTAKTWVDAKALPDKGDDRKGALEDLTAVLPTDKPNDYTMNAPPLLKHSTAAPLAAAGPFFDELRKKMAELAVTEKELVPLTQKKLADEKAIVEKQLAALRESLKLAAQGKRQAEYKRFREENFPWPELTEALMAKQPASAKPDAVIAGKPLPPVTKEQFIAVMTAKCIRCHRYCNDLAQLTTRKWILPGNPEKSPVYTCLGVAKNRKLEQGKYHDVADDEKLKIYAYIKGLQ